MTPEVRAAAENMADDFMSEMRSLAEGMAQTAAVVEGMPWPPKSEAACYAFTIGVECGMTAAMKVLQERGILPKDES